MSNNPLGGGGAGGAAIECRPARAEELPEAAGLILSSGGESASAGQITEFLNGAAQRSIDLSQFWIVLTRGKIAYAVLPICSPGRTMLLITPARLASTQAAGEAIEQICGVYAGRDVQLAQVLLDPEAQRTRQMFKEHRFVEMAELIYLQGGIPPGARKPELHRDFKWETYSPETHELFATAIQGSYRESLDCPRLNGVRTIEDVIEGHRATGEFDPELWQVLCLRGQPVGVLLLSRVARSDAIELVYLGLSPEARGKGLGNVMMSQAIGAGALASRGRLTLAVDADNGPALKLYYRHGLQRMMSKIAMIRNLESED